MSIEPINSAMSYQAAPLQQPVSAKPAAEYTDGTAMQEMASQVDYTTARIEKSDKSGDTDGQNGQGGQNGQNSQNQTEAAFKDQTDKIKKYIEELNKKMTNSEAQFGIHEATNRVTIKIVDKETKEVIKELPPEKTLDMIAKAWELAGILVDEKR